MMMLGGIGRAVDVHELHADALERCIDKLSLMA
jgi:hypothetical protein